MAWIAGAHNSCPGRKLDDVCQIEEGSQFLRAQTGKKGELLKAGVTRLQDR